jgi:hypothetical protein
VAKLRERCPSLSCWLHVQGILSIAFMELATSQPHALWSSQKHVTVNCRSRHSTRVRVKVKVSRLGGCGCNIDLQVHDHLCNLDRHEHVCAITSPRLIRLVRSQDALASPVLSTCARLSFRGERLVYLEQRNIWSLNTTYCLSFQDLVQC